MKSDKAKVIFPIAGKAMVQRVVDTALKVDCSKIVIVVGHMKESVMDCITKDKRIEYVEQTQQLGTGHAVICAQDSFENLDVDVLILCGDVPLLGVATLERLITKHRESKAACTLLTAFLDDPGKYGRILRDDSGQVNGIVEYKDATESQRAIKEWNTGIYCFNSRDMFDALGKISNSNQQNEYYLTDTLAILRSQGKTVASIVLEKLSEVTGVNSQAQLAQLEDEFIDQIRNHWMDHGVMMHNPNSIYIEDDVILAPDVELGSGCLLKGKTSIAENSQIGPNCLIINSQLAPSCQLKGHNILINSQIPAQSVLDFAQKIIK